MINTSPTLLASSIGSNDLIGEKNKNVFKDSTTSTNHPNEDGDHLRQSEDKNNLMVVRPSQDEVRYIFFIKIESQTSPEK